MYESDRYFTKRVFDEQMSESSGISLSQSSTCTERYFPSTKSNLLQIAERRNETQTTFRQVQSRQHSTPIFPKIENKVRLDVKTNQKKIFDFRLPKMQSSVEAPSTVGKNSKSIRQVKVAPILNLPTPNPPQCSSPPGPMHLFIRDQYIKERYQQSPGFTNADMMRIFDRCSLSRYLISRESSSSKLSPIGMDHAKKNSFPAIRQNAFLPGRKTSKSSKLVWVPQLSSWVPEFKGHSIKYLKFGKGAKLTVKHRPICCKFHDFYHHNLNWDVRNWVPSVCPRYSQHHHQHHHLGEDSQKAFPSKLAALRKRKQPTIPKDPFSSGASRNLKRPWLKPPSNPNKDITRPTVHLVVPHEDDFSSHWMIDNSTMTEESFSDILSLSSAHIPSSSEKSIKDPVQVKKKRNIVMIDKACDVMTPWSPNTPHHSTYTEESDSHEEFKLSEETSAVYKRDNTNVNEISIGDASSLNVKTLVEDEIIAVNTDDNRITEELVEYVEKETLIDTVSDKQDSSHFSEAHKRLISDEDDDKSFNFSKETKVANFNEYARCKEVREVSSGDESFTALSPVNVKQKPQPPPPRFLLPELHTPSPKLSRKNSVPGASKKQVVVIPLPSFAETNLSSNSSRNSNRTPTTSQRSSTRRRKGAKDTSIADEMKRALLAEERRKRAIEKFENIRKSRQIPSSVVEDRMTSPDGGNFLDRYCIHNPNKMDSYRRAFDSLDIDEDGFLDSQEVYLAIQKLLPSQTFNDTQVNHICRLLELVNYDIVSERIDIKLFTIIASLAQKIAALDDFMKGLINRFDLQSLDSRMWRAREFFNYFVDDHDKQTISMESLWVELKAGGIGQNHENQIRESLKHLPHLDILDFMTYLPLFTLTHSHAVNNPINNERVN